MNSKLCQRHTSPDAERNNFIELTASAVEKNIDVDIDIYLLCIDPRPSRQSRDAHV